MMRSISRIPLLLSLATSLILAAQVPFLSNEVASSSSFSLPKSPSAEQTVGTYSHPQFPAHTLRFVEPEGAICERHKGTRSWSGYLDVNLDELWKHKEIHGHDADDDDDDVATPEGVIEHFYFWAFESRSNPKEDPTVMWLNGGPGCSSGCGMLMELGPCNAMPINGSRGPHTAWNPHSWSNNASLLFLDQPVGTGFSYVSWADPNKGGKAPSRIYTAKEAGRDASAFLQLFGMHAEQIYGQPISSFHIAGESYAGRWIPLIADQLIKDNKKAIAHPERGFKPLPLDSVLIGNGITSPKHQFPAYVEYSCANTTGFGVFLSKETCDTMYSQIPACIALVDKCNTPTAGKHYDEFACKTALNFCETTLQEPWSTQTKRSTYDWQHEGAYPEDSWFEAFLNDNSTKASLGIDKTGAGDRHDGTFLSCSDNVYNNVESSGDGAKSSMYAVKNLLENEVRVLLYAGERDFICNYLGIAAWSKALEWSGAEGFRKAELVPWKGIDGREGGLHQTFGNLTFLRAHDSGHFYPHDQPENSLVMFNAWVHNKSPPS